MNKNKSKEADKAAEAAKAKKAEEQKVEEAKALKVDEEFKAERANAEAQKAQEVLQSEKSAEATSEEDKDAQKSFQTSYELEDQRLEDAQKDANEEGQITDNEAIKTDGTANVNADKSLPTTDAQKEVPEEVRTGEVEQPNLNKTVEERLGLANPDTRLAEELREAKLQPAPTAIESEQAKKFDVDDRTDDVTFPDGAMKAQERKDAKAGYEYHIQEAKKSMSQAQKELDKLDRLAPKQ